MTKITVLGGSGFLGSHLADFLSKKGYSVTIFDLHKSKWRKRKDRRYQNKLDLENNKSTPATEMMKTQNITGKLFFSKATSLLGTNIFK